MLFGLTAVDSVYFGNKITIDNDEYSITYPSNMELVDVDGVELLLFTEIKRGDNFNENLNLIKQDITTLNLNLKDYVELSESQILNAEGEILLSELKDNNGVPYQRVVYRAYTNRQNLKYLQHYYIVNDIAYVLTFTAEEEDYDQYVMEMEKTMISFKIHDNAATAKVMTP